jgi:hypothetical protein
MILSIATSFMLLGVFYDAPPTTMQISMLVECVNGFYASSTFPAGSGQGSREVKGAMDDWCVLNMEARDRDDKIVEREMRKFFMTGPLGTASIIVPLIMMLAMPPVAIAHEGHPHRFMGTVSVVQDAQIEVTLTDGKVVTFALDAKTIYRQGKTKVIGRLPKDGERVVVSAMPVEKAGEVMIAVTVQLPPPPDL